jgi:hypothetical protein
MRLRELWARITSTRYTRELEAEVLLLRAENRGLLNSILGIAGIPPVLAMDEGPASAGTDDEAARTDGEAARAALRESAGTAAGNLSRRGRQSKGTTRGATGNRAGAKVAVPMRRRSWQQINRMLEFESGKKKREG